MSPVSVEVRLRILADGAVVWEQTLSLPQSAEESPATEGAAAFEHEERVLPLSTSVVSPGLFLPAPA
jgi:hypothetical protein